MVEDIIQMYMDLSPSPGSGFVRVRMICKHFKVESCCLCLRVQLEAIPESLKNMLLVMDTAGIFHSADSRTGFSDLWEITWERIVCFLPHLKEELFKQTVIAGRLQPRG